MGLNERLAPYTANSGTWGSVATNSSAMAGGAAPVFFVAPVAGEVVGARLVNGTTTSIDSGTTLASGASAILYANASGTASRIATWNSSGTVVATNGRAELTISGTTGTTNARLASGSALLAELLGGAANNNSNAGAHVEVDFMAAYQTGATPSAGTGPA
mgnify:CR=1 FL=1